MRTFISIIFISAALPFKAQSVPFLQDGKWGIKEHEHVIIPASYDTVFPFDPTGRVCLACHRQIQSRGSGFIKIKTTSYRCNYLDKTNRRLIVRNIYGDTSGIFSLGRNSVSYYNHDGETMTVSSRGRRHLVDKNFRQLTFKGYHHVEAVPGADFYLCQFRSESEAIYSGIVSTEERQLVPFRYSSISINTSDSLIIACSAGFDGSDDVYDYSGRKLFSTARHITSATRALIVQRDPDKQEQYYLVSRVNDRETSFEADEVAISESGDLTFRKKRSWYTLDAQTGIKKPIK